MISTACSLHHFLTVHADRDCERCNAAHLRISLSCQQPQYTRGRSHANSHNIQGEAKRASFVTRNVGENLPLANTESIYRLTTILNNSRIRLKPEYVFERVGLILTRLASLTGPASSRRSAGLLLVLNLNTESLDSIVSSVQEVHVF